MKKFILCALSISSFCMMNPSLFADATFLPKPEELTFDAKTHKWIGKMKGEYDFPLHNDVLSNEHERPITSSAVMLHPTIYISYRDQSGKIVAKLASDKGFPESCTLNNLVVNCPDYTLLPNAGTIYFDEKIGKWVGKTTGQYPMTLVDKNEVPNWAEPRFRKPEIQLYPFSMTFSSENTHDIILIEQKDKHFPEGCQLDKYDSGKIICPKK